MSALALNKNTPAIQPTEKVLTFAVINADIIYAGSILAIDSALEIQPAADSAGLRVLGRCPLKVNNTADGEVSNVEHGVFRYENSSTAPLSRANIGQTCYIEDDQTVASASTHLIAAGIVFDVDSDGVWVDQTPAALAQAVRLARPKIVANTGASASVSAAQAFQGNVVIESDYATAATITLPSAVAGYRIGIQRLSATAAHDTVIQAASGDKVRGSTAAGTATNAVDAISDVLFLEAKDATDWVDAAPIALDRASWVAST